MILPAGIAIPQRGLPYQSSVGQQSKVAMSGTQQMADSQRQCIVTFSPEIDGAALLNSRNSEDSFREKVSSLTSARRPFSREPERNAYTRRNHAEN
jgi:hypothetical protein